MTTPSLARSMTMFEIGDRVFTRTNGYGEVIGLHLSSPYPVKVRFYKPGDRELATTVFGPCGEMFLSEVNPDLDLKHIGE